MINWKVIVFIGVVSFGAYQHFKNKAVTHGNGVMAAQSPQQQSTTSADILLNGYRLKPL